jgi:hypothetical protein
MARGRALVFVWNLLFGCGRRGDGVASLRLLDFLPLFSLALLEKGS